MQMVAASKMRKTQKRMQEARPYAHAMRRVIHHIADGHIEYHHPFLTERKIDHVGYIIVSTDRGLCGGLNINEFRQTVIDMKKWHDQNVECEASIIGSKGISFFSRVKLCRIVSHASGLGEDPGADDVVGTVTNVLKEFAAGNIDRVYLVFNKFVNTMVQKPVFQQLLPLPQNDKDDDKYGSVAKSHWDYIYEPDAKVLLDELIKRYIQSQVYSAVLENLASEQSARMVAMKAASENAGSLIDSLQLEFNKARQAGITQEITEIVSGAAAV